MTYKTAPKKPYEPVPLKPYAPKPLKPYTPVSLKDYKPVPIKLYKPVPLKSYTPVSSKKYKKALPDKPTSEEKCPYCGGDIVLLTSGVTIVCRHCRNKVRYAPD